MSLTKEDIYNIVLSIITAKMHNGRKRTKLPPHKKVSELISKAVSLLELESSLLKLEGDFVVVGDTHGKIDDLLRIFERKGYPPATNYLFLGDYVDRGYNSIEVLLLLYSLKVLFPDNIYLVRGNHECESITTAYGFKRECCNRLSEELYSNFVTSFQNLPFAAVINSTFFCVHGGISPDLESLDDINELYRPMVSADSQIANDMVWSDPCSEIDDFLRSDRGSGYLFSATNLKRFLKQNDLDLLIRSHECCEDGFDYPIKRCLTIFSNTDYCGGSNNAAFAVISEHEHTVETIEPLTKAKMEKRRAIVPEWIFNDDGVKSFLRDPCTTIPADNLLDMLSGPPLMF